MKTYGYQKSREIFERAAKVIPAGIYGHLGPAEGCFIPVSAYPFYIKRAEGAYFWDVDGNRFIDYMCAYGPIVLGYNHPAVERAAQAQREQVDCGVLPGEIMVRLAEKLVSMIHSADWAFFAKNGGDVTNLAVLAARAHTRRKKIIKFAGGYHGVAQWMQFIGNAGIIEEDVSNIITVPFNDVKALREAFARNPGQVAGLIATPYHHPAMADNALPEDGFWQEVRGICTREGALLIIDDVRAGFRLSLRGSDHYYGFEADLLCYCKALGNGYNISALCGKNAFREAVGSVFYTGSYWLSAVPMAAALAALEELERLDGANLMLELGRQLTRGLKETAQEYGYHLLVTGEPSMWYMRLTDDDTGVLHQQWVSECVRRGVFFTNHHNLFMNTAMTKEDISYTLDAAREAFQVLRAGRGEGSAR